MYSQLVIELQAQIETLFAQQASHFEKIVHSAFPAATLKQPEGQLSQFVSKISESVFLDCNQFAQKGLLLHLADSQETILLFEFGLMQPENQDIGFRNLLLTCLINSQMFGDDDNPFLLMCSKDDYFWDTEPPAQATVYVQLAQQLFDALADWRFKP
jgi:hypothetical protein